jgi:hypothetical protein
MRTKRYLAALLVAVGSAALFAAPAVADDETDERFINMLEDQGVPVKRSEVMEFGKYAVLAYCPDQAP